MFQRNRACRVLQRCNYRLDPVTFRAMEDGGMKSIRMQGELIMLFITHALPMNLLVDELVKRCASASQLPIAEYYLM